MNMGICIPKGYYKGAPSLEFALKCLRWVLVRLIYIEEERSVDTISKLQLLLTNRITSLIHSQKNNKNATLDTIIIERVKVSCTVCYITVSQSVNYFQNKYITKSVTVDKHCCSEKFELSFALSSSGPVLQVMLHFVYPKYHEHHDCTVKSSSIRCTTQSSNRLYVFQTHIHEYPFVFKPGNNHTKSPGVYINIQYSY